MSLKTWRISFRIQIQENFQLNSQASTAMVSVQLKVKSIKGKLKNSQSWYRGKLEKVKRKKEKNWKTEWSCFISVVLDTYRAFFLTGRRGRCGDWYGNWKREWQNANEKLKEGKRKAEYFLFYLVRGKFGKWNFNALFLSLDFFFDLAKK